MEWQDIKTAPKDGTAILLGITGYKTNMAVAEWEPESKFSAGGWLYSDDEFFVNPTHWMPLPKHPTPANGDTDL